MKPSSNILKQILKFIVVYAAFIFMAYILLVIAYTIPVNPVSKESTYAYINNLGWDPLVNNRYEAYVSRFNTFEPGVLNDSTDKIILNYSYCEPEISPVYQAANMNGYGRYWHGYVIILRVLFRFINYWDIPLLNGMLQIMLVIILCMLVQREIGQFRYVIAVATSYLLLMPVALAFSLQFAPVFYLSFIGSIIVLAFPKVREPKNILMFFFILGMLTAYFDFFTYFLLVWAYPICWYLILEKDSPNHKSPKPITIVISSAIIWSVGFVMMYPPKWLILYLVCGKEAFVAGNIGEGFILFGDLAQNLMNSKETYSRFGNLYTNWRHYMYIGYEIIILGWCFWGLYRRIRYGFNPDKREMPLMVVTLSAPVWYLVFYAHSATHHFFTYRDYAASIVAFILFICVSSNECSDKKESKRAFTIVSLMMATIIGWFLCSFSGEHFTRFNGGENENYLLRENDVLEFTFTPSYKMIKNFGIIALPTDDLAGEVIVRLSGDETDYELKIPVSDFGISAYQALYTDWKLKPGASYNLSVSLTDNTSGINLLMTPQGTTPFPEYYNATLNGQPLGATHPLGQIVYFTSVVSKKSHLFLALIQGFYMQAILALAIALYENKNQLQKNN